MAPKKKGGAKALLKTSELTAFLSTYKAAARRHGVAPDKALVALLEEKVQDAKVVDKISLQGPDVTGGSVCAIVDCLAGYVGVKNLCCWSCSIGDKGLAAVAQLLKSSVDRWYRGSKLKLLEITNDGSHLAPDYWNLRFMDMVTGKTDLVTRGLGFAMPSLLMAEAEAVTAETAARQASGQVELPDLERQLSHLMASTATRTTSLLLQQATLHTLDGSSDSSRDCNGAPAGDGTVTTATTTAAMAAAALAATPGWRAASVREVALAATSAGAAEGGQAAAASHAHAPSRFGMASSSSNSYTGTASAGTASTIALARQVPLEFIVASATAPPPLHSFANGMPPLVAPEKPVPLTFSPPVLKDLSLALGTVGVTLTVLVLDHNALGNVGASILSLGLKRCKSLKQLSLARCSIGPSGAVALGHSLRLDPNPLLADLQPRYVQINLSGNPFGGQGLAGLSPGLAQCAALKFVAMADVGLTEQDVPALQVLAEALVSNSSIDQVDLDANFIGDAGAAVFIPVLRISNHMRRFRITSRVSRPVGEAVAACLKENFPTKKKAVKKKK